MPLQEKFLITEDTFIRTIGHSPLCPLDLESEISLSPDCPPIRKSETDHPFFQYPPVSDRDYIIAKVLQEFMDYIDYKKISNETVTIKSIAKHFEYSIETVDYIVGLLQRKFYLADLSSEHTFRLLSEVMSDLRKCIEAFRENKNVSLAIVFGKTIYFIEEAVCRMHIGCNYLELIHVLNRYNPDHPEYFDRVINAIKNIDVKESTFPGI